ncbi:MAG: AmmeMemoRadiSam system protein B, partial [Patescibacteria group bacterium]
MKRIIFIILSILLFTSCSMEKVKEEKTFKNIRSAMTAGQFYSADEAGLRFKIEKFLEAVTSPQPSPSKGEGVDDGIKAIMVPHAGLDYSGGVAAYGYNLLKEKEINTVIIICNSHSTYFSGIAIDNHDAWETPLGVVAVDTELANKLVNSSEKINFNEEPFNTPDQTLEIQVPFLQVVIENSFKIVPIFFGNEDDPSPALPLLRGGSEGDYQILAEALAENLGENDIVVASTDMSHYPVYESANTIDKETLNIIKTAKVSELEKYEAEIINKGIANEQTLLCGIDGVKTTMELYKLMDWNKIEILKYANSGDVLIGDKSRVVGYGAVAFSQGAQNTEHGTQNTEQGTK